MWLPNSRIASCVKPIFPATVKTFLQKGVDRMGAALHNGNPSKQTLRGKIAAQKWFVSGLFFKN